MLIIGVIEGVIEGIAEGVTKGATSDRTNDCGTSFVNMNTILTLSLLSLIQLSRDGPFLILS